MPASESAAPKSDVKRAENKLQSSTAAPQLTKLRRVRVTILGSMAIVELGVDFGEGAEQDRAGP